MEFERGNNYQGTNVQLSMRRGAGEDAKLLRQAMEEKGFEVYVYHDNTGMVKNFEHLL
jgi:hypothetical protein